MLRNNKAREKQRWRQKWCFACIGNVWVNKTRDVTGTAAAHRHSGIDWLQNRERGQTKEAQNRQNSFEMSKVLPIQKSWQRLENLTFSGVFPNCWSLSCNKEAVFGHKRILLYWRKLRYKVRMNNKNIFILHSYITQFIKLSKIFRNNKKTIARDCLVLWRMGFWGRSSFGLEMYNQI